MKKSQSKKQPKKKSTKEKLELGKLIAEIAKIIVEIASHFFSK